MFYSYEIKNGYRWRGRKIKNEHPDLPVTSCGKLPDSLVVFGCVKVFMIQVSTMRYFRINLSRCQVVGFQ